MKFGHQLGLVVAIAKAEAVLTRTSLRVTDFWLWVKRNDTVVMQLVTSIVLSGAAIYISYQQTEATRIQALIAEAQALPRLEIKISQRRNEETGNFEDNVLNISNMGGPVHDFRATPAYFLKLSASEDKPGSISKQIELPAVGYYVSQGVTGSGTGLLTSAFGNRNNRKFGALRQGLSEQARNNGLTNAWLDEQTYLRVKFYDLLDRYHEWYFRVDTVAGGSRIQESEGKRIFDTWDRTQPKPDFESLDAQRLLDRLRTSGP